VDVRIKKPPEERDESKVNAWNIILTLINKAFCGKEIPKSFGTGILVLIPKGVPDQYRGIALLEVIYKLISAIITKRINSNIHFHEAIHGFRKFRGTGTAIIEMKLRMQLAQRTTEPLFMIFLDLKKAYDTLDRGRTINILQGYGVGKMTCNLIKTIWDNDVMVPKQAGFYGKPFKASRGVRQGDIMASIIFNITTDAVIRESLKQFYNIYLNDTDTQAIFYADDGVICGNDAEKIQFLLDIFTTNFARIGLKMNVEKTKSLIMNGGKMSQK
jgi:Reverse transcriptase (RNA-dependent DNA polymerase)